MIRPVPRQFPLAHEATAIAVAADGKRMAAAAATAGQVVVYDVRVGRTLARFNVTATALAFLPDGVRLVTAWSGQRRAGASRPSATDVPASSTPISSAPISSSPVTPAAPFSEVPATDAIRESLRDSSRDSSRDSARDSWRDSAREVIRGTEDEARRSIRMWDVTAGSCLTPEPWFGEAPIAVSPDGRWIAAAADRVTTAVLVLRVADGQLERMLELPSARPLRSLSFSPDGKWLVATTGAAPLASWSTDTFAPRVPEGVHDRDVALAHAHNGLIAVADELCNVRVFAPGASELFVKLSMRDGPRLFRGIEALSFSPDDAFVVARGRNGTSQIFNRASAQPLWTASPGPMAFLPDGKTIVAWWSRAIWMREAETGDLVMPSPDEPPSSDKTQQDAPKSRRITLRSGEPDVVGTAKVVHVATPIAPVIVDEPEPAVVDAATSLIARLSSGWSGTTYRHPPINAARDPDGLGVRLPLRGGFAYVQIRLRKDATRVLIQVNADEPDLDPPPSSSLERLSRWIRDRFGTEARRQAVADREWAAELAPDSAGADVRIERVPGSLTIVVERPVLPSVDDIEALVHKAEQKLAS